MQKGYSSVLLTGLLLVGTLAVAQSGIGPITTSVHKARQAVGAPATRIAAGYKLRPLVDGSFPLENPSGVITNFGLLSDSTKTEPDQNLYLVFGTNPGGPTAGFDYGRHFLFQGHENSGNLAYVTRINLDVRERDHKITLLTPVGAGGLTGFNSLDGSTYDPFTKTLLFTEEAGSNGGVVEISSTWPPVVKVLDGILGKAGYEGIHPDDQGDFLIIEDAGGPTVNVNPNDPTSPKTAKQPNSFVYRFVPNDKTDLSKGGKLEALQVSIDGTPLEFHADDPGGDTFSLEQLRLHTLGTSYPVQWVTIHDTAVDGTDSFDANAKAKAAHATPFKRPENAQFLPGSYQTFFFDPTGDTDATSGNTVALAERGAWGSIFRVDLTSDRETGLISILVLGDADHASFDNLTFADTETLLAAEDRGDTLHDQLNKLDSVWAFSVNGSHPPLRFVALGRDASAAGNGEEDNEPTGLHVSNGSTDIGRQPGTLHNLDDARGFLTKQHGNNIVWQIFKKF